MGDQQAKNGAEFTHSFTHTEIRFRTAESSDFDFWKFERTKSSFFYAKEENLEKKPKVRFFFCVLLEPHTQHTTYQTKPFHPKNGGNWFFLRKEYTYCVLHTHTEQASLRSGAIKWGAAMESLFGVENI